MEGLTTAGIRIIAIKFLRDTCHHSRTAELLTTGVDPGAVAKQLGHILKMFL